MRPRRDRRSRYDDRSRKTNGAGTLDAFLGRKPAPSEVVDLLSSDDDCRIVEDVKPTVRKPATPKSPATSKPAPKPPTVHTLPALEYPGLEMDIFDFVPSRDIDASTWPRGKDGSIQVSCASWPAVTN